MRIQDGKILIRKKKSGLATLFDENIQNCSSVVMKLMVGLLLPGHHKREGWQGGIHQGRPRLCPTGKQHWL
jgi:hypothetical protein